MYSEDIAIENFIDFCDYMQIDEYEIAVEMDKNPFKTIFDKFVEFVKWIWEKITKLFKKNKLDINAIYEESKEKEGDSKLVAYVPNLEIGNKYRTIYKRYIEYLKKWFNIKDRFIQTEDNDNKEFEDQIIKDSKLLIEDFNNIKDTVNELSKDKSFSNYDNGVEFMPLSNFQKFNNNIFEDCKNIKGLCDEFSKDKLVKTFARFSSISNTFIRSTETALSSLTSLLVLTNRIIIYSRAVNNKK